MLAFPQDGCEKVSVDTRAVTRYFQLPTISFTQNCWVGDLLANREYKIRVWSLIVIVSLVVPAVPSNTLTDACFFCLHFSHQVRETCTDPLANSPFFERLLGLKAVSVTIGTGTMQTSERIWLKLSQVVTGCIWLQFRAATCIHHRYQECTTLTMPAFDPTNLTAYDEDLYTFEACAGTIFWVVCRSSCKHQQADSWSWLLNRPTFQLTLLGKLGTQRSEGLQMTDTGAGFLCRLPLRMYAVSFLQDSFLNILAGVHFPVLGHTSEGWLAVLSSITSHRCPSGQLTHWHRSTEPTGLRVSSLALAISESNLFSSLVECSRKSHLEGNMNIINGQTDPDVSKLRIVNSEAARSLDRSEPCWGDDPAVFGCRSLVRTTTNCTVRYPNPTTFLEKAELVSDDSVMTLWHNCL